jgi:hypothetical protein
MKYSPEVTGGYMKYLSEVTVDGVQYESWVIVHEDGDADFAEYRVFVDYRAYPLSEIPDLVQDELLDAAIDLYRADDGADAAYDAMRDA